LVLINHKSPEPPSAPSPVLENHLNAAKNKEFKMTIFREERKPDDETDLERTITVPDATEGADAAAIDKQKPAKTGNTPEPRPSDGTVPPDVVQRADGNKMPLSHQPATSPPPSSPSIGNHVPGQGHRRAEENPYAKPSEMKPTKNKKTGSRPEKKVEDTTTTTAADTKPKGLPTLTTETLPGSDPQRAREDVRGFLPTMETTGPDKKRVTTFSVEAPTCKNPVCLKEHSGDGHRLKSPLKTKEIGENDATALTAKQQQQQQQHIKGSKSMSGLNDSPEKVHGVAVGVSGGGGGGTRSPPGVRLIPTSDRYKTLPSQQPKVMIQTDGSKTYGLYSRAQNPPGLDAVYGVPPSRQQPLGHYVIPSGHVTEPSRGLPKMPVAAVSAAAAQRQLPPTSRSQYHEPQIHGFQPSLPPDPIPAHLRSKSLTPRSTPGGHVDRPTSSPTRKLQKTFEATSLDDLLSPPFGHITVDKHKQPRTQGSKLPKPGDKDEYGTAV